MPDKDIFQRTFAPGWRRVYRIAEGAVSTDSEISAACVTALTKSLREGCPGLKEIAEIVNITEQERKSKPLFVAGGLLSLSKPFALIRQVEQKYKGQRVTKVMARAARTLLVQKKEIKTNGKLGLIQNLVEEMCLDLLDHQFFGRGRNYLVQRRFGSFSQEREWEYNVKEQMKPSLSKLAALVVNLLKNSNSMSRLRAPSSQRIRKSTRELLDEPLTG